MAISTIGANEVGPDIKPLVQISISTTVTTTGINKIYKRRTGQVVEI